MKEQNQGLTKRSPGEGKENVGSRQGSRKPNRRSIRLPGYDYSQAGAYFVTICTKDRSCLFGDIINREMVCDNAGRMVETVWNELSTFYPRVSTDAFQVMPNHIHGIIVIARTNAIPPVGAGPCACPVVAQPRGNGRRCEGGQPQGVAPTEVISVDDRVLSLVDIVNRFKTYFDKTIAPISRKIMPKQLL